MSRFASDDENLIASLTTLGEIKAGEVVDVASNGKMSKYQPTFLGKIMTSNFDRKGTLYLDIKQCFLKGGDSIRRNKPYPAGKGGPRVVTRDDLNRALAGIGHLVKTLKDLKLVKKGDEEFVNQIPEELKFVSHGMEGHRPIYDKYARFCLFKIDQKQYLKADTEGVCHAFVLDWIRRKYVKGKESYNISKHMRPIQKDAFDQEHGARIQKKIDRRIAAVQERYGQFVDEYNKGTEKMKPYPYYEKQWTHIKSGFPALFGVGLSGIDISFNGSASGPKDALDWSKVENTGDAFAKAFAAQLLENVKQLASVKSIISQDKGIFQVGLKRKNPPPSDGPHTAHSIGIQVRDDPDGGIQVFDPNLGDFFFPGRTDEAQGFLVDLWKFYKKHDQFEIHAAYYDPPAAQANPPGV